MARQQNTFAKRAREMEKRRKANEKLARRRQKKEPADGPPGEGVQSQPAVPATRPSDPPQ